jgi:hypothetical protein
MLFKIIDDIRTKPKPVRDQYAFMIALFCTLAIGGVWSLSLPSRFAPDSQVAALASTTNAVPFSNFFTQLKNQFRGVTEQMDAVATTTAQLSAASSTEAALDLQLSPENKDKIKANETTESGSKIQFGNGTQASSSNGSYSQTVLVGTSSASTTRAR